MIKKILLAATLILPAFSMASDTYDASTGNLYIPDVSVGDSHYEVDMIHQGDLVFKVTSASPVTSLEGSVWLLKESEFEYHVLVFGKSSGIDLYTLSHTFDEATNGPTVEFGTYSWNSQTGEFKILNILTESDGDSGLSRQGLIGTTYIVKLVGNELQFHEVGEDEEEDFVFLRQN